MEDREKAKQIVEEYVNQRYQGPGGPLVVIDDETREKPYGWIFLYCPKKWLETHDMAYLVAGNGPIVFDKRSQKIHQLGTAGGPEQQIQSWEKENLIEP